MRKGAGLRRVVSVREKEPACENDKLMEERMRQREPVRERERGDMQGRD